MKHLKLFSRYIVVLTMMGLILGSNLQVAGAAKNVPVRMIPENFSSLAKHTSPAVVHIRVEKNVKRGENQYRQFGDHPFRGDDRFKDFWNS